jgi:nitrite reductase/ring-hydroxylating ferredoxin subunit
MTDPSTTGLPRRQLLCGALLLGAAGVGALAGCGGGSTPYGGTNSPTASETASAGPSGTALAKVSDVPVGGGHVVTTADGTGVLIVQPEEGTFKAYNDACTHRGTRLPAPMGGIMTCPAHGSEFKATDGSVVNGPATQPLTEIAIKVTGQDITLA